jgi:hypothetical protein
MALDAQFPRRATFSTLPEASVASSLVPYEEAMGGDVCCSPLSLRSWLC